jgi:hypothetical protein
MLYRGKVETSEVRIAAGFSAEAANHSFRCDDYSDDSLIHPIHESLCLL